MSSPIVSIVVPFYNQLEYLAECIGSVIIQTFDGWELIIVDDASTEEGVDEILSGFDKKIRLIRHASNRGLGAARNTGFEAARGQLVLPLDSDDFLHPTFVARTLAALDKKPDADCVFTDFQLFGCSDEVWKYSVRSPSEMLTVQWIPGPGTVMYKRVWQAVGGYDEVRPPYCGNEDWDFWIAAVENGIKAVHVPEALYNYRRTSQSMSVSTLLYYDYITRERIYRRHKSVFDRYGAEKQFRAVGYLRSATASLDRRKNFRAARLALRGILLQPRHLGLLEVLYRSLLPDRVQPLVSRLIKTVWKNLLVRN
jgi:glycosyltransferase involved in cell wall biosynthesis